MHHHGAGLHTAVAWHVGSQMLYPFVATWCLLMTVAASIPVACFVGCFGLENLSGHSCTAAQDLWAEGSSVDPRYYMVSENTVHKFKHGLIVTPPPVGSSCLVLHLSVCTLVSVMMISFKPQTTCLARSHAQTQRQLLPQLCPLRSSNQQQRVARAAAVPLQSVSIDLAGMQPCCVTGALSVQLTSL